MKKFAASLFLFALPTVTLAQAQLNQDTGLVGLINDLIGVAIPIIFALAVLFFLYKLLTFLFASGENRKEAQKGLVWALIVLIIMFSIGGILQLIQNTFGVDGNTTIEAPTIDIQGGTVTGPNNR